MQKHHGRNPSMSPGRGEPAFSLATRLPGGDPFAGRLQPAQEAHRVPTGRARRHPAALWAAPSCPCGADRPGAGTSASGCALPVRRGSTARPGPEMATPDSRRRRDDRRPGKSAQAGARGEVAKPMRRGRSQRHGGLTSRGAPVGAFRCGQAIGHQGRPRLAALWSTDSRAGPRGQARSAHPGPGGAQDASARHGIRHHILPARNTSPRRWTSVTKPACWQSWIARTLCLPRPTARCAGSPASGRRSAKASSSKRLPSPWPWAHGATTKGQGVGMASQRRRNCGSATRIPVPAPPLLGDQPQVTTKRFSGMAQPGLPNRRIGMRKPTVCG